MSPRNVTVSECVVLHLLYSGGAGGGGGGGGEKPWSQSWLIAAGAYPGFCSMKRLEVFLLPWTGY